MLTDHRLRPDQPVASISGDTPALLNRELSALEFQARVLELAADPSEPLLERVRFTAIVSDALDEFFAIRVGGLIGQALSGVAVHSADGLAPRETLAEIRARVVDLTAEQSRIWETELRPALADNGIEVGRVDELPAEDLRRLGTTFERQIRPSISPRRVGPVFPHTSGLQLMLGLRVIAPRNGSERLVLVPVPAGLPRFVRLDPGRTALLALDDVLTHFAPRLAPGTTIAECSAFRVTRDADFEVSDHADDLLEAVRDGIGRSRFGAACRLEVASTTSRWMVDRLVAGLGVGRAAVYRVAGTLALTDAFEIAALDRPELKRQAWRPRTHSRLSGADGPAAIFDRMRDGDIFVHHPYDSSATSYERLLRSAAVDPDVRALKTTVYRIGQESPVVPALLAASDVGKEAVCLVELRARGDEHQNIECARILEDAGVHVVHGFPDLKVHAKTTLVVRHEGDRLRRYAYIGTGNYPADAARIYEDFGLFTADADITADVADLFDFLTGFGRPVRFRKLLVAPLTLRPRLVELIAAVAAAAAAGERAHIQLKVNALTDPSLIEELYRASQAGAEIDIVARSICMLHPGVPGLSENIRVRSIVGRFLEHSRVYVFHAGAESTFLIGSADLMPRNLDHRVEVVAPVEQPEAQAEITAVLDALRADNRNAWELSPTGDWQRVAPAEGERQMVAQRALMRRAAIRDRQSRLATQPALAAPTDRPGVWDSLIRYG